MALKIYNTLTRKKEEFKPIHKDRVGIYVCGITAYDSCHLGHARAAINFDIVARYLRHKGFKVQYARNFTDVDDKIINRANREGKTCKEISETYIEEYRQDMKSLNNITPDIEPKATEHINDMIETVRKLISNGLAYEKNGNVFFSVRKFTGYGKLSGKNIDDLESGARIDINEAKEDPLDFALWKASKPGEPEWESPWGKGRPGWHIECSSMSSKYLGQPFDIHGGGRDLVFPHHENEIAQAEGAEGKKFVGCWMHNGFININAEKMSKSLGNFLTIREAIKKYGAETIRYFIISNHYRSPIDFTDNAMKDSTAALDRFYETAKRVELHAMGSNEIASKEQAELKEVIEKTEKKINEMMDDDFNTAGALGAVFELIRSINRFLDTDPSHDDEFYLWFTGKWTELLNTWGKLFGTFQLSPNEYFETKKKQSGLKIDETEIKSLIEERLQAKKNKNFVRADEIRNELQEKGIILKDLPGGKTEWGLK